jgi:class 3 adenylate cyclase
LHGEGVNVAARLEAECPPGGICVSRAVRDHRTRSDWHLVTANWPELTRPDDRCRCGRAIAGAR